MRGSSALEWVASAHQANAPSKSAANVREGRKVCDMYKMCDARKGREVGDVCKTRKAPESKTAR
ncbi:MULTISPECIES: hypothetical protein [unclassified Helicobacter]|uniref:hypothetical protein n=1 Tax=unclassified Helicobacter TaxID=2593540 RepID=UPI00115F8744|nr:MULTISPECIES: hypothetical protein [unclassified Helicobacter]